MAAWTDPQTVAAIGSAAAALFAAIATWRAPLSAARMAENLRKSGDQAADRRRFKLNVFATLMQERSEIYSVEAVRALNSVDVAFSDAPSVREAWAELYQALNSSEMVGHVVDERLRRLLREMAEDLGLSNTLRLDDFGRVYIPNAIAEERRVRDMRRKQELTALIGGETKPDGSTALDAKWPPSPE